MSIIQEIAEDLRREQLQTKRVSVRYGASMYARRVNTRIEALEALNICSSSANLSLLKKQLRAMVQARKAGSWMFSLPRYIAILQCIGGELILAGRYVKENDQATKHLEAAE